MSAFHLRPVSEPSSSPTPSISTTPPRDRSPPQHKPSTALIPSPPSAMSRPRRPLSPTSLRDVDLTHDGDMPPRKYPAPPTGHDLMALFPPAPPEVFPEMRPGPTSGFFQRQERAFFAQAGKEIVRVRVEVDLPHDPDDSNNGKSRARDPGTSRQWTSPGHAQIPLHPHPNSPPQSSTSASAPPPVPFPHPNSRPPRGGAVPVTPTALFPVTSHAQPPSQPPPNLHPSHQQHPGIGLRTPPQDSSHTGAPNPKPEFQQEDDSDEAWRRPMPYAERRRAGKHTRRVIVRN